MRKGWRKWWRIGLVLAVPAATQAERVIEQVTVTRPGFVEPHTITGANASVGALRDQAHSVAARFSRRWLTSIVRIHSAAPQKSAMSATLNAGKYQL